MTRYAAYQRVSPKMPTLGVRVSDTYGISTTNLLLTLLNFGLNKGGHYTLQNDQIKDL